MKEVTSKQQALRNSEQLLDQSIARCSTLTAERDDSMEKYLSLQVQVEDLQTNLQQAAAGNAALRSQLDNAHAELDVQRAAYEALQVSNVALINVFFGVFLRSNEHHFFFS